MPAFSFDDGVTSTFWNDNSLRVDWVPDTNQVVDLGQDISSYVTEGSSYYVTVKANASGGPFVTVPLIYLHGSYIAFHTNVFADDLHIPNSAGIIDGTSPTFTATDPFYLEFSTINIPGDNWLNITELKVWDESGKVVWDEFLNVSNWVIHPSYPELELIADISSTYNPAYSTALTSLSFVWPGFDSLYDMGIGLFNERSWKEWEDWYSEWSETDPSIVSSGKTWAELD